MSSGVGLRCGWDLELLWLWCSVAATALIPPLAWELLYAMRAALKRPKTKTQDKNTGEGVEKREPYYIVGGNVNWCNHCVKQYGDSSEN